MRSAPSTATLVAVMGISDLWLTPVQLLTRESRERDNWHALFNNGRNPDRDESYM